MAMSKQRVITACMPCYTKKQKVRCLAWFVSLCKIAARLGVFEHCILLRFVETLYVHLFLFWLTNVRSVIGSFLAITVHEGDERKIVSMPVPPRHLLQETFQERKTTSK
jgi:hypothetical protein